MSALFSDTVTLAVAGLSVLAALMAAVLVHRARVRRAQRLASQGRSLKRLVDAVTSLQQQNAALAERLQTLDRSHRQLAQQVMALRGRVADDMAANGDEQILH